MKKLVLSFLVLASMMACTPKEAITEVEDPNMVLFRENAKVVDASIKAYVKNDIDAFASAYSETVKYHSAVYGESDISKAEIITRSLGFFKLVNNLSAKVTLLPGVDSVTFKPDGSVRAYIMWSGDLVNNAPKIDLKVYASYKLDKDHKIYDADEYFDVTGFVKYATATPIK
jgi:hypothetical protein